MASDHQVLALVTAAQLLGQYSFALTGTQLETVASVGQRFGRYRRDAEVTAREWAVVDDAVMAMRLAAGQRDRALTDLLSRTRAA